jgi:hypothetical protein
VRFPRADRNHLIENRDAEQRVTPLQHEEKSQEHEKSVQGELQLIDTSLLMGDPIACSARLRAVPLVSRGP